MVMAGDQSAGRSDNIKTDNSYFERAEQFKYLGTATLRIKLLFSKKLTKDCSQVMHVIIWGRAFCVTVCCTNI
jgi:hypothetical protein